MKKCLLFAMLFMVLQLNNLTAQVYLDCSKNLITISPDTACINQPILFTSNITNAINYSWSFCAANLSENPIGTNLGKTFHFQMPSDIDIVKDGDNYYGFVLNSSTREMLEMDFGNSLDNIPAITNISDLAKVLPTFPSSLFIVKDSTDNTWHIFVTGGTDSASSSIARLDFGKSLNNRKPAIANFGNFMGVLNAPRGIFVGYEGGYWYGYCVNNTSNLLGRAANNLIKLDFGSNISKTPLMTALGDLGVLKAPADMKAVWDCVSGAWYFYVTNFGSNQLVVINIGTSIAVPNLVATPIPESTGQLFGPWGLSITRDCDSFYVFVNNYTGNGYTVFASPVGPGGSVSVSQKIGVGMNAPTGLSSILRDHGSVYTYAVNQNDNSLTKILLYSCSNATVPSSNAMNPPRVSFSQPGFYNVYYTINEGTPNMQTQCAQIYVHNYPKIQFPHDTTICHPRDTVYLYTESVDAMSYTWSPSYNLVALDSTNASVKVWPEYSTTYNLTLPFPDGCIVDTPIHITVVHVKADAGPDRTIFDGASTVLGGPMTTEGPTLHMQWFPAQYLNRTDINNPTSAPPFDYTYYLQVDTTFIQAYPVDGVNVIDTITCSSIDTVVVHVMCNELNLPNAFVPASSNPATNRFGLLNHQIIKLNYLKIYDRWGALVFETEDPTKKWDGTVNSKNADAGVYIWEADGFCTDGKKFTKTGNVTLIR